jgi:hypothetical protein
MNSVCIFRATDARVLSLISGALVYTVQAGQAYRHADELSRGRAALAGATLAGNHVPLKPLTVSSLQTVPSGVDDRSRQAC